MADEKDEEGRGGGKPPPRSMKTLNPDGITGILKIDGELIRKIFDHAVELNNGEDHPYPVGMLLGLVAAFALRELISDETELYNFYHNLGDQVLELVATMEKHCAENHQKDEENHQDGESCYALTERRGRRSGSRMGDNPIEPSPDSLSSLPAFFAHDPKKSH